jgi:hypothetical protein
MSRWSERVQRIDGFLGRLVFRAFGVLCGIIALVAGYAAWSHVSEGLPHGWAPAIMFGVVALTAALTVPYCFSRKRNFAEALDAMEGGVGDQPRRR